MTRLDQLVVDLAPGDAITDLARLYQGALRSWGYASDIYYSAHADPSLSAVGRPLSTFPDTGSPADGILLHYSIHSAAAEFVLRRPQRLIILYHNVTPARYFLGLNSLNLYLAFLTWQARRRLPDLASRTELALGVSEYNRRELERMGFGSTAVLPLAVDWSRYETPPDQAVLDRYGGSSGPSFLFVGRIAPNKHQEDVIRAFQLYKERVDAQARLFLVGSHQGNRRYYGWLRRRVQRAGLSDVVFTGRVSQAELIAYYRLADLFVCMSEHEGFGVPLLESMHFDLPVLAYAAGAVPETLGGSGVLITEGSFEQAVEWMARLVNDEDLRRRVVAGQRRRLADFTTEQLLARFRSCIEPVMA